MNSNQKRSNRVMGFLTVVGVISVIIDVLHITYQINANNQSGYQFTIAPSISSSTILLVLLLCLPILLPLIKQAIESGLLRQLTRTLRKEGIEEIETNIIRIKLTAEANQSSKAYEEQILAKQETSYNLPLSVYKEQFASAYTEVVNIAKKSDSISSDQAMNFINELATYYDDVRERFPGSADRTRLMTEISSIIWSLIPKTKDFPALDYINHRSGGKRIAAYKYIEWQPQETLLDDVLIRAMGTLEVPFGQYSALMALQRMTTTINLTPAQNRKTLTLLKWHKNLRYLETAQDRRGLISKIIAIIEQNTDNAGASAG